jgi:hypothetical protein
MVITADPASGVFSGAPRIEFVDTPGASNRRVRVFENFSFREAKTGTLWAVPAGSFVDGASIPRVLWTVAGSPFTGDYVYASLVHDVACITRTRSWQDTHRMFYLACLAGGVSRAWAKVLYLAVRTFGPKWPAPAARPTSGVAAQVAALRALPASYELA